MESLDIAMVVATTAKWLIYTGLLWVMIKIQKLNYNVAGLFGSSLAAVLVSFIPFGGSYLSYVVLVICLWKCTGADIAPDIVFTVGIAAALMFCVNLWVIGMLMGHLRPDFAHHPKGGDAKELAGKAAEAADDEDDATPPGSELAPKGAARNSNPAVVSARTPTGASETTPITISGGPLSIRGVARGSTHTSVLISDGTQVHTVSRGDSFTADIPDEGRIRLRCEEITQEFVVLTRGGGRTFQLRLP